MNDTVRNAVKGYGMILLSALGFGSYGIWSKLIGSDFGIFSQGWVRSALILLMLIPIGFATKKIKFIEKADIKYLMIPVIFSVFTIVPIFYAFNNVGIGTATLVFYALFLITTYLIGVWYLGEKITKVKIISLILAFGGLLLIFGFSIAKFSLLALSLAAINGIASGGEVATTKKITNKYSSIQISIFVWFSIFITHLPLSFATGESWVPFSSVYIWSVMIIFSVVALLSFWLVIEGFKYVDASVGGLIGLTEIIFAVVFGILFFSETITTSIAIGGFLILLSGMLPDLILLSNRKKIK